MTKLDRRSFVAALATSLTSAAAAQASGKEAVAEHPDLLALADRLPSTLARYKESAQRVEAIVEEWSPQWPEPGEELFTYDCDSKPHRDILGCGISTPLWGTGSREAVRNIGTPEGFQKSYERYTQEANRRSKLKTKRGMQRALDFAEESKAAIEPARAYWTEVERIKAASCIESAAYAKRRSREALIELVGDILTFEEQSAIGLGIKAEALAAFTVLPRFWQGCNPSAPEWLTGLTATLERRSAI